MNKELIEFIKTSHRNGLEAPQIKQQLMEAGWAEADVDSALKDYGMLTEMSPPTSGFSFMGRFKKILLGALGLAVLFFVFSLIGGGGERATSPSPSPEPSGLGSTPLQTTDETQYLVLGIPVAGIYEASKGKTFGVIDKKVESAINRIGLTGDGKKRQLGFLIIMPPWLLENIFPGKMEWVIKQAFEVAKKRNAAFYLTIESHFHWDSRSDLWNWFDSNLAGYNPDNKNNVEWTDWDGTPVRARYSLQENTKLKPHMCYNSPQIKSEIVRLVKKVIAPAVAEGIENLKKEGRENLFAGITLTSELSVDDYSVIDKLNPGLAKEMEKDGAKKVRLGYCALTNAGYSKTNPPKDFAQALAKVNQEFAAHWAKQFVDAGISKNKLYNHVAAGAEGTVLQYTNAPIETAFNDYSRPGWTTYPTGPLYKNFNALYKPLKENGNPHWASAEAAPITFGSGPVVPMQEYLNRHFDNGATVMVMNSADPAVPYDFWSNEAIAAYRKFLNSK